MRHPTRRLLFLYVLLLSVIAFVGGCISDAPFKFRSSGVPAQLSDGWTVAVPESVGLSSSVLEGIHDRFASEEGYYNARTLLIIKDGKLIYEAFARDPADRDRYQHIQSMTKSVTSILFGIALAERVIDSLDQTLYSILPDKFPADAAKRSITFRQLLTMRSGIDFDNDVFSVELYADKPSDPIRHILEKPMYNSPGVEFYYRDCDPHLISAAMQRRMGRTLESYGKEKLLTPLGITDYFWYLDPSGTTTAAHGLHIRPRDMAKLGQLMLDKGVWKGTQIVDSTWLDLSTTTWVDDATPNDDHNFGYGFYWWTIPDRQSYSAWGHGGNFIFVQPSKRLVAVMTSMPDAGDDAGSRLEDFEGLISPLLE